MALAQRRLGRAAPVDPAARHPRRRAVLRRRHHHAGDLGAVGGRRPEDRHAGVRSLCRAADAGDPGRLFAVQRSAPAGRGAVSARSRWSGSSPSAFAGLWHIAARSRRACARSIRAMASRFLIAATASSASSRWAPCSSPSPAPRRSTPISAISAAADPARLAGVVFPALTLNYFGQGAFVLANPKAIDNPFFLMYPGWALLPMVVLATAATVIASQAVISGAFSLTRQAMQLGLLPRLEIRHTSETQSGPDLHAARQRFCCSACCCWSSLFRSSSALASAYGIAVTGTMVVTTHAGLRRDLAIWRWRPVAAALLIAPFLFDRSRRSSAPICSRCSTAAGCRSRSAAVIMLADVHLAARQPHPVRQDAQARDPARFRWPASLEKKPPLRVPGTAVFLTSDPRARRPR